MRRQDRFETLQWISLVLLIVGVLALGLSFAWRPLGWEQPTWSEDQQDQFAKAAREYHALGHRIDPKENEPDYAEKLRVAKAAYDVEHEKLTNARNRGEFTIRALFYGGMILAGLGVIGTRAANAGN